RADVGERGVRSAVVAVYLRDTSGAVVSGEQDVEVAVIVIIAPGDRGQFHRGQTHGRVTERGVGAATVSIHLRDATSGHEAGEQDVEIAILVVVTPCHGALLDVVQSGSHIGEGGIVPAAVSVQLGRGNEVDVGARDQDVEVSVVVVVPPCHRTYLDRDEGL